jgi:hypothetical protein
MPLSIAEKVLPTVDAANRHTKHKERDDRYGMAMPTTMDDDEKST